MTEATIHRIDACSALSPAERERMYALFSDVYEGSNFKAFERDLGDKHWVVRIFDAQGALVGFTTVRLQPDHWQGRDLLFVFSGDTVMARQARGSMALAGCFAHVLQRAVEQAAGASVWWVLLSKGHRTYRYLPLYFHRWHPRAGQDALPLELALLDRFCGERYGTAWKAERGLVVFEGSKDRLNDAEAAIPEGKLADPAIRFFLERNPGFRNGDELACLAEVCETNMKPRSRSVLRATALTWGF